MILRSFENAPLDTVLETDLRVYGSTYSIDTLREPLMDSAHGEALASLEPRYSAYWKMWEDIDKFKEMYGPDVDPVAHGPYQARTVAIPLLRAQFGSNLTQLDSQQEMAFVAHHVQHDDHEGAYAVLKDMTHDVGHRTKTQEIEDEEFDLWLEIQRELFEVTEDEPQLVAAREFEQGDGFLSRLWNISERIGYISTGIQSVHLAIYEADLSDAERDAAWLMGRKVVGRHYPLIEAARDEIAIVDSVLASGDLALAELEVHFDLTAKEIIDGERN